MPLFLLVRVGAGCIGLFNNIDNLKSLVFLEFEKFASGVVHLKLSPPLPSQSKPSGGTPLITRRSRSNGAT